MKLNKEQQGLYEKYKNVCLLMKVDDSRTIEQTVEEFNKKNNLNIDYRWCAVFKYIKPNIENLIFYGYNQFIILS